MLRFPFPILFSLYAGQEAWSVWSHSHVDNELILYIFLCTKGSIMTNGNISEPIPRHNEVNELLAKKYYEKPKQILHVRRKNNLWN